MSESSSELTEEDLAVIIVSPAKPIRKRLPEPIAAIEGDA